VEKKEDVYIHDEFSQMEKEDDQSFKQVKADRDLLALIQKPSETQSASMRAALTEASVEEQRYEIVGHVAARKPAHKSNATRL